MKRYKFMNTEYEATFANIDKKQMRRRLEEAGAELVKKEFLQKRYTFNFPSGHEIKGGWARVRDEGDKITMSIKINSGDKIHHQKEYQLTVDNFQEAKNFLLLSGFIVKSYQETKREVWILDDTEIMIDEWPFLEPLVEIEGKSANVVKRVCQKLGFNYGEAIFGPVTLLYQKKYDLPTEIINNHTPKITFKMKNPFKNYAGIRS